LGRTAEAEAALAVARDDRSQPAWFLEARTADYYVTLGNRDRATACYDAAVTHAPEIAETHLALAEFQVGHLERNATAARASLERALQFPVGESLRWAATRIEGMVLLEEGDAKGALLKLQAARRQFRRLADSGINVLADAHIGAYLCLAYSATGDRESAVREFRAAESWLAPHGLDDLLERCRIATENG
jgi:tetratricopeptide (TPR) repeat protein